VYNSVIHFLNDVQYTYSILLFFLIVLRRFCVLMHCACRRRRRRRLDNIKMFIIIYCCSQCTSRAIYNMRIILFYAVNTHTGPAADSYMPYGRKQHHKPIKAGVYLLLLIYIHNNILGMIRRFVRDHTVHDNERIARPRVRRNERFFYSYFHIFLSNFNYREQPVIVSTGFSTNERDSS